MILCNLSSELYTAQKNLIYSKCLTQQDPFTTWNSCILCYSPVSKLIPLLTHLPANLQSSGQQLMNQVLGSLLPTLVIQAEFQAPVFERSCPGFSIHLGSELPLACFCITISEINMLLTNEYIQIGICNKTDAS